jgi:hypothetical protein
LYADLLKACSKRLRLAWKVDVLHVRDQSGLHRDNLAAAVFMLMPTAREQIQILDGEATVLVRTYR